ncbi:MULTISPECIES: UDP-N-acetylmuramate dehydrogenase [Glutamicibacter]|jgi:UDP-N-acetylmuramate dehydrogenase|uniref:UDP-N-acetylenolpyruvoylglucosamine reductase n=1 Tax=Glutamicibacter arilaitensis TaxID=256701 RepID=A0A4Y8TZ34_9MICC|nr:UDP-N-acetylmuramate dehydrogenase [Glutamicibacter arilaitensis]TFH56537.1 UDP-N-acetylmuramate dehydrogenase [Glutamicibacter arilaitensis]
MLKNLTTTRVGGPAQQLVTATSEAELAHAVGAADDAGNDVLLIGGGSNLVICDEGYPGVGVQIATRGLHLDEQPNGKVLLRAAAGENWDVTVEYSLTEGLSGLEALSGIPGCTGATPVQNVGAYGADVSQTLAWIRAYDRHNGQVIKLQNADLEFAYRDSLIKRTSTNGSPRYVVLEVAFLLERSNDSAPIRYAELARRLGVEAGERADAHQVRQTVLELRRSKGMVYDRQDADSHSTGSFFTNPIVPREILENLPDNAPNYPVAQEGFVKLSAAWLIDQAGFSKGYGLEGTEGFALAQGRASLSTKHTLAITNRGEATAQDILAIARAVRAGVAERFGIELVNEPLLIGLSL